MAAPDLRRRREHPDEEGTETPLEVQAAYRNLCRREHPDEEGTETDDARGCHARGAQVAAESTPMKRGLKPVDHLTLPPQPPSAAESTPMKRGLKQIDNAALRAELEAAESTPMKRGLKRCTPPPRGGIPSRGRREHPDEEGTETAKTAAGWVVAARKAAESTPMKRGLKPTAAASAPRSRCSAAESTPMKRGLKLEGILLVVAGCGKSRREHPDEEGTETHSRSSSERPAPRSPQRAPR